MDIGILNQRVTLLVYTDGGQDSFGQPVKAWSALATVWANVRFVNGREFTSANREAGETIASIRIRRRAVSRDWRVLYKGVAYNITAVLPGSRNEYVDLAVTAVE